MALLRCMARAALPAHTSSAATLCTRANAWPLQTIAITGAEGGVGSVLAERLTQLYAVAGRICAFLRGHKVVAITLQDTPLHHDVHDHRVADLSKPDAVAGVFDGCDVAIHLAALPKPWEPWERVYANNIAADGLVYQEAVRVGLRRVVYASSCHTQHGASMLTTPETLRPGWGRHASHMHRLADTPTPSSLYGAAKTLGEQLGRFYARVHGLEVVAVRIGWLLPSDDPSSVGDDEQHFMRSLYLSHADAANIFDSAVSVRAVDGGDPDGGNGGGGGGFAVVYASSNNGRSMLDRTSSEEFLQYTSVDDAEQFF